MPLSGFHRLSALILWMVFPFALSLASDQTTSFQPPEDIRRADALIGQGRIDQALDLLKDVAQRDPKTPGLSARLGKAYYEKHKWGLAVENLKSAIAEDATDAESTQLLGLSYFMNGQQREAIPVLEKVQSLLPHPDPTGSYLVGVACIQTYQYDRARVAFAHMFAIPPDSGAAHLMLAKMMVRHDFNDQAIPEVQKALELDPRVPMGHFLLGELLLLRGKVQEAIDEFHKEIAVDPMMWLTYWRMGEAYTKLDQWNPAEDALKKSIWLNQNFTGPYVMMGKVQLKKGNPDVAAEFLERAREMDPSNPDAHFLLGKAYSDLGRGDESKKEFEQAQKLRDAARPRLESLQ